MDPSSGSWPSKVDFIAVRQIFLFVSCEIKNISFVKFGFHFHEYTLPLKIGDVAKLSPSPNFSLAGLR